MNECVTIVEGMQWGDEGKGAISYAIAEDPIECIEYMGRPNGGPQAGHTVYHNGKKVVLHLVPSGIFFPGITCFIGAGTVIDAVKLVAELEALKALGIETPNLVISPAAHFIMPWHKEIDRLREATRSGGKLGTTQSGVGPCYADKSNRAGFRLEDLGDPAHIVQGVLDELDRKRIELAAMFPGNQIALPSDQEFVETAFAAWEKLWPLVQDVEGMLAGAVRRGDRILIEAAQAAMLDIDHGTYPFVTSSGCTTAGVLQGAGIPPFALDRVIGVSKAYVTRVGEGPMPTEEKGEIGDRIRRIGKEFGSTTGRPRRPGWLDLPALKRAIATGGAGELALTKIDVLTGFDEVLICKNYAGYGDGEFWKKGKKWGEKLTDAVPEYVSFPGWKEDIQGVNAWSDLCSEAKAIVEYVESAIGIPITRVCTGPERHHVIRRPGI